jgi:hypothetical protein
MILHLATPSRREDRIFRRWREAGQGNRQASDEAP